MPPIEGVDYNPAIEDTLTLGDVVSSGALVSTQDIVSLSDDAVRVYRPQANVVELLSLIDNTSALADWRIALADMLDVSAFGAPTQRVSLVETLLISIAAQGALGVSISDLLALDGVPQTQVAWAVETADGVTLVDAAQMGLAALLEDTLTLDAVTGMLSRLMARAEDALELGAELPWITLTAVATLEDRVELSEAQALHMALFGDVLAGVRLTAGVVDPRSTTRWAINTRTGAITEYRGRSFDSYGYLGSRFVGMSGDGLWAIEGDSDDGQPIGARLRGGVLELNGSRLTGVRDIYVGMRLADGEPNHFLKLISGDGKLFVYRMRSKTSRTTPIRPARGLRSRYFQWELELVGPDFTIDEIEFVPMIVKRRGGR